MAHCFIKPCCNVMVSQNNKIVLRFCEIIFDVTNLQPESVKSSLQHSSVGRNSEYRHFGSINHRNPTQSIKGSDNHVAQSIISARSKPEPAHISHSRRARRKVFCYYLLKHKGLSESFSARCSLKNTHCVTLLHFPRFPADVEV